MAKIDIPTLGFHLLPIARWTPRGQVASLAAGEEQMTPEEIDEAVRIAAAARIKRMRRRPEDE